MKIGIDISQSAFKGSGVGRYTEKLVEAVTELDNQNAYTFFYSSLRQNIDLHLKKIIESHKHALKELSIPPTLLSLLWNDLHILPVETFVGMVDVFLSSDWTQPPTKQAKKITIVHDMIAYRWPELLTSSTSLSVKNQGISANIVSTQKKRLSWVKKECDHIIADSEHTKKDLQEYLHISEDKISVVYPYVEIKKPSGDTVAAIREKYDLKGTYILSVGKLEPRKNIRNLIDAFSQSGITDATLVIVGPQGWGNSPELQFNKEMNIRFLGYVPDEDLYALYAGAEFFIYPSLYEGFGYPIVEAMSLGCPVATSEVSSLKEIAEDNAYLFDPKNVQNISKCISEMHINASLRQDLAQKGIKRAAFFSKQSFVKNLISVLTA
jgi:glycosyltransferase involved in cell wall biosynthesis